MKNVILLDVGILIFFYNIWSTSSSKRLRYYNWQCNKTSHTCSIPIFAFVSMVSCPVGLYVYHPLSCLSCWRMQDCQSPFHLYCEGKAMIKGNAKLINECTDGKNDQMCHESWHLHGNGGHLISLALSLSVWWQSYSIASTSQSFHKCHILLWVRRVKRNIHTHNFTHRKVRMYCTHPWYCWHTVFTVCVFQIWKSVKPNQF